MLHVAVFTFFRDNGSIAAQCSSIYPNFLPENHAGFPAISFSLDKIEDPILSGGSSSLYEALLNIECFDGNYNVARQLADTVSIEMVGLTGTMGTSYPVITLDSCRKELDTELPIESDTGLFHISLQFRISYV